MTLPLIYDYDDYRRYLSDWFDHKKQEREQQGRPAYSHRMFVAEAGVPNVGVLVSVIKGDKHLTEALQAAFCIPLGLNEEERRFLGMLAARDKARRQLEKARAHRDESARAARVPGADKRARRGLEAAEAAVVVAEATLGEVDAEIVGARRLVRARIADEERLRVMNAWSTVALAELVRCVDFRPDPEWMASRLGGRVSPDEMQRALDLLLSIGALKVREDGRIWPADDVSTMSSEHRAALVETYYRGAYEQAGHALARCFTDLEFARVNRLGTLTIAIPSAEIPRVRERMMETRVRLFEFLEGLQGEPDMVYQVWMQGFPLTELSR